MPAARPSRRFRSLLSLLVTGPVGESLRVQLPPLPSVSQVFTMQFLSLFLAADFCQTVPSCACAPQVWTSAGSPALVFGY